ncbi:MAG: signal peptide peptidase SppA [Deltaproteobacteria bacterium]|jgi:protease-4|nr:signal peptide peptidase SppA [Deltaproteobacteria bacterium]
MIRLTPLLVLALASTGCITLEVPLFGSAQLVEQRVYGEGDAKILMIDIDGTLSNRPESGTFGFGGRASTVARVRQQLEAAVDDDAIRALLLRIDSPGGTVIASDILYREVLRYKRETGLPVVAQIMGMAASGGYYVAMAADEVRAYPSAVTGSIGVIMAGLNLSGLLDKVGVENQTLTTGAFKDAGSPLREMRPEERSQLQTIVDDLFQGFLDVVDRGRPDLDRAAVEALADGRIYSARQARENGLIDALGDLPEAIAATTKRAGIEDEVSVVVYHREGELRENLFSNRAPRLRQGGPPAWLEGVTRPSFLYLWAPWGDLR